MNYKIGSFYIQSSLQKGSRQNLNLMVVFKSFLVTYCGRNKWVKKKKIGQSLVNARYYEFAGQDPQDFLFCIPSQLKKK